MSALEIRLFGHMRILLGAAPSAVRLQPSSQSLLAYLLLHPGRLFSREQIVEVFWAERDRQHARNCLTTALWRLRHALETTAQEADAYVITTEAGEVGFNWRSRYWLDVERFEQALTPILRRPVEALGAPEVAAMEQALTLYAGDLLEDLYDDWALRARERMRSLYLNSLAQLMHYHAQRQEYPAGLAYGRRILELDPLREEVHRALMQIYVDSGRRPRALRQYELCRHVLREELDVAPMATTEALYQSIASSGGAKPTLAAPGIAEAQPALQDLAQAMTEAMAHLASARRELDAADAGFQACLAKLNAAAE